MPDVSLLIQSGFTPTKEWIERHFRVDLQEKTEETAPQGGDGGVETGNPAETGDMYESIFGTESESDPEIDFSEAEVYDFTRCVRPDGTAYGTVGKCRSGTEEAKKIEKPKVKREKFSQVAKKQKEESKVEDPKEAYLSLLKKRQEMMQKNDFKGAAELQGAIDAQKKKMQNPSEVKNQVVKKGDEAKRENEERDFETAQRKRNERQKQANLSEEDKKVILDYTTESEDESARSYRAANGCLRYPKSCRDPEETKNFTKNLDSAISKLPKNEEKNEFYRAVNADSESMNGVYKMFENAKPGMRVKDPGYGSYSAERNAVKSFVDDSDRSILFISRNRDLTPINEFSEWRQENEAVLPRGTEQIVRKVTKEGNTLIVEFD